MNFKVIMWENLSVTMNPLKIKKIMWLYLAQALCMWEKSKFKKCAAKFTCEQELEFIMI